MYVILPLLKFWQQQRGNHPTSCGIMVAIARQKFQTLHSHLTGEPKSGPKGLGMNCVQVVRSFRQGLKAQHRDQIEYTVAKSTALLNASILQILLT